MKKNKLIGRKFECGRLRRCINEDTAQLVVVYGRRRVGKTFLVDQFFNNNFDFKLTGSYNQRKEIQLRAFSSELERKTQTKQSTPKDWIEAFEQLRKYLNSLTGTKKRVVFFDEMPWLDTRKSDFLPAFEWFWNDWASTRDNLVIIVCGSATTWMVDKIANNKGGLFNRQTCRIYLEPFNLNETEKYLESKGIRWNRYDIAECYMIMGGIPYYLSLINPEQSLSANIDNLFFKNKAELWDEYNHLFKSLFANGEQYEKIVELLSKKRIGYTHSEISSELHMINSGNLSKYIRNLQDSGFIRAMTFYGNRKKETVYQLSDYYTLFYFRFIKSNYGKDEQYWSHTFDNPIRTAWAGLTFEQLCRDHVKQIKRKLGISGVLSDESTWFSRADEEGNDKGAQIDLLIDRRDRVINLCEIKYSINEFKIDKSYDENLRNKVDAFRRATGCKKSIQITMITTYGVRNNKYSNIVQNQILLDDLFADE